MNIQMIPLNRLVPSSANVRKTGRAVGIEELAASIKAHGLLQNLQVRPASKDRFEVVAGGRRLAALKLLAKQKQLAKDAEIGCHVLDTEDAAEISLAENTVRLSMHPADQYAAFRALSESGSGPEDIAARFGVTAAVVRQRLKLAAVSPVLFDLYRQDEMSLDQLMAFAVSDDPEAQEAAWFDQPQWQRDPAAIRRTLTAAHVEADDRRVLFVGLAAYQAAGGEIVRDLFQPDHEGYLTHPALLDKLVAERLEAEATAVRAEGWAWVEIMPRVDYAALRAFGRVEAKSVPLSPEAQEEQDRLAAEYEALAEQCGDDPDDETSERLDALSAQIEALAAQGAAWRDEDKAVSGALIGIGYDGKVEIERGLLRAEDRRVRLAFVEGGKGDASAGGGGASPLSAKLVEDLTAERTAALRAMLADNEKVALAAVAHALALPLFYPYGAESCLDIRLKSRDLRASAERVEESGAAILSASREAAWRQRLPETGDALFGWLLAEGTATVTSLIAFCAAQSVDAVRGKQDRPDCRRLAHADEIAASVGLDMADWWEPTKERYLGRVSKALILDAVTEGVSAQAAENLAGLKKEVLVARAEQRLAGRRWLPGILRKPESVPAEAEATPLAA